METLEKATGRTVIPRWLRAFSSVSYRLPMQVTKVKVYRTGNGYPVCPRCAQTMEREYSAYCDRCGQRLGWERFDEAEVVGSWAYEEKPCPKKQDHPDLEKVSEI